MAKTITTTQSGQFSTTPVTQQAYIPLRDQLMNLFLSRLRSPSALPPGYESQGVQDINATNAAVGQGVSNDLTARGLSRSPIAGAVAAKLGASRAGQISQFRNQIPLLNRQMQNQDLASAFQFFAAAPTGQTGTQSGTSTQKTSGIDWSGLLGNILGSGMGALTGGLLGGGGGSPQSLPSAGPNVSYDFSANPGTSSFQPLF